MYGDAGQGSKNECVIKWIIIAWQADYRQIQLHTLVLICDKLDVAAPPPLSTQLDHIPDFQNKPHLGHVPDFQNLCCIFEEKLTSRDFC